MGKSSFAAVLIVLAACGSSSRATAPTSAVVASAAPSSVPSVDLTAPVTGDPVLVPQITGAVGASAISADGRYVFLERPEGDEIVEVATGAVRGFARRPCATRAAFTATGRYLVTNDCGAARLHVWDLTTDTWRDVPVAGSEGVVLRASTGDSVLSWTAAGVDAVDAGTLATTRLDLPKDTPVRDVAATADGGAMVMTKHEILLYPRGASTPRRLAVSTEGEELVAAKLDASSQALALAVATTARTSPLEVRVVEVASGETLAEGTPCGKQTGTSDFHLAISPDGQHVLVACSASASAEVFTRKLEKERTIEASGKGYVTAGTRVVSFSPSTDVYITDMRSDEPRREVKVYGDLSLDAAGARLLAADPAGRGARVIDLSSGESVWSDIPANRPKVDRVLPTGFLVTDGDKSCLFDLAGRSCAPVEEVTSDGKVDVVRTDEGTKGKITFTERGGNRTWTIAAQEPRHASVSAHGTYVVTQGMDYRTRTGEMILVIHSATSERSISWGNYDLGPKEDFLASVLIPERPDPNCWADGPCCVVRLTRFATGATELIHPQNPIGALARLEFSASGAELRVASDFYDVATKKLIWSLEKEEDVASYLPKNDLVLIKRPKGLRLVEARTGKTLKAFDDLDGYVGESPSGEFFVASSRAGTTLVDTSSLEEKPLTLRVPARGTVVVTDDGAFIWASGAPTLVVHRVSDGRSLRWDGDASMTDELVVDPSGHAPPPFMTRRGPSVLGSPMEPVAAMPEAYSHPGLVADFFGAKPVSPR
ncbi:MAG: hypothetical protein U0414_06635 [Polyangiaceae bacterium]